MADRPGDDPIQLQSKIEQILHHYRVDALLKVTQGPVHWVEERLVGRGRPGPHRPRRSVEQSRLQVTFQRCPEAIQQAEALAGWRLYVTNTPSHRLDLPGAIGHYRTQWQPERGFHRFKRGPLSALPLYLREDDRIRGLMLLLGIALRVLTLMEFVVRQTLHDRHQEVAGLYEGNPHRSTPRPTAEKLLLAFRGITLYRHHGETHLHQEITPLSLVQARILELMNIPQTIYAGPEPGPSG